MQVCSHMEHHCSNSIQTPAHPAHVPGHLLRAQQALPALLEALHAGTPVTNNLLEKMQDPVSQSNDLSSLQAK